MPDEIVPKDVDTNVEALLKRLGVPGPAVFVPVRPDPGAVAADCFANVDRRVTSYGGTRVHGWRIWLFPGVWLAGEFHAVWKSPSGDMPDVTPSTGGNSILFAADPVRVYTDRTFNNEHYLISEKKLVADYAALVDLRTTFVENRRVDASQQVELTQDESTLYKETLAAEATLLTLVRGGGSRNQNCPCGSGSKFKHCHEASLGKLMKTLRRGG